LAEYADALMGYRSSSRRLNEGFHYGVRIEYMAPIKFLRPACIALIALLTQPCLVCLAQDQEAADVAKPAPADPAHNSIIFPGGPLSKLVASLNARKNSPLSIIQPTGLDPILPAFSINNARTNAVIEALGQIVEQQGYRLLPAGPSLAVLTRIDAGARGSQAFASFQLENKIGARAGRTAEDIIAAIQLGCEFASAGQPSSTLRFKYHPGTKLLFVAGTQQEIGVANQVFGSLPDGPGKEPPPSDKK
jgi:hypothetical protein